MTNKSKNKVIPTYVEIRDAKRKAEKQLVSSQLTQGDYLEIIRRSGKSDSTVYKALNPKQQLWSQSVIDTAKAYIEERDSVTEAL